MREKGQRGGGKRCLNDGTETLRGQEGRLTKRDYAETRFRWQLVTYGETAFVGSRGAWILSQGGGRSPHRCPVELPPSTLPTQILGLFSEQKLIRGQTRNSRKALLGLMLQHKGAETNNRLPCLLPEAGVGGELVL